MTHDFTRASVRDPGSSLPPAYMSSLQSGYEEPGAEQLERLQQDINNIKNNYKRANVSDNGQENIEMLWYFDFFVSILVLFISLQLFKSTL